MKTLKLFCIFLGLFVLSPFLFVYADDSQGIQTRSTIPNELRRPDRGEAPRLPQDNVIGELGRGTTSEDAWRFANNLLSALIAGAADAPALAGTGRIITESLRQEINSIEPRTFRLGGGRAEADGSVSYLVRFLGWEENITGELFLRREESETGQVSWVLDDLILEEAQSISEIRERFRFDFSPYERFF